MNNAYIILLIDLLPLSLHGPEVPKKYVLDTSELNEDPSRIMMKRFIDVGFKDLSLQMSRLGYSYHRESRPFVKGK